MFQGLDPATGEVRCAPLWRADPRSKLAAGPLLEALTACAAAQGIEDPEDLARSKALEGDIRSVQAACRLGGAKRVKVETVERLCRKVLDLDPRQLYGEGFERAWQHKGKRVNERVQAFDHCFSSPKSVSLLAAGGGDHLRRQVAEARAEALDVGIGYLERHGIGVRRDHNGTDRHHVHAGVLAVAFEHRMSRSGDPQFHTHVLVQNAAHGPDGRWTALDSDRLYAHLMAADHLYLVAERAALTERLGVRWGPVDERSGAAEIVGLDDRGLIERFSKRSGEIDHWLAQQGLSGIKASSAAAVATRQPKDRGESEQSVYARWARELAEQGVGERQLAEVCTGGRGRPATRAELDAALTALGVRDWQVQAALARSGVRLAPRSPRLAAQRRRYTEERIAARVAALGFADVQAYLLDRVVQRAWLLAEVAAELGAHRLTVRRLLARSGIQRVRRTPAERVASEAGHRVQAVSWQARRAGRLAELGFADLAAYLRARQVEQGWSVKRMRAELRVGRAWLVGELARLGLRP